MFKSLRLTGTIRLVGRTVWNADATLSLEPLEEGDNRWLIEVGSETHEITPSMFRPFEGRTVALVAQGRVVLCEFEHIGFLYAVGLRGVLLRLEGGLRKYPRRSWWPPFMCSAELLQLVRENSRSSSPLAPYKRAHSINPAPEKRSWGTLCRRCNYTPNEGCDSFCIHVFIDYGPKKQNDRLWAVPTDINDPCLARIVAARTFARPAILEPLSRAFAVLPIAHGRRWPHRNKIHTRPGSQEGLRHTLLDKMILAWMAPPDSYATGTWETLSSHQMDIEVLRSMWGFYLRYIKSKPKD